ncbi:MAG: GntR family transcriptional regulator [Blastocatellia bacterium]
MKLWLSKNSEVGLRDQIVTQITLGIASGDLMTGRKLPSTRELARRYSLHPNTVSAAYQTLVEHHLIRFKHGSGYFVSDDSSGELPRSAVLERLIGLFIESARNNGFSDTEIFERLDARRTTQTADRILLVESDNGLREIVVREISDQIDSEIATLGFEEFAVDPVCDEAILTAMFDEKPKLDPLLSNGQRCVYLNGNSVSNAMSGETRPAANETLAVVSGWDGFLAIAKVMLLAAKIEPGSLIVRSTKDKDWRSAIRHASIVVCDLIAASKIDFAKDVRVFHIVSQASIDELRTSISARKST